jgi:hypothetical protein
VLEDADSDEKVQVLVAESLRAIVMEAEQQLSCLLAIGHNHLIERQSCVLLVHFRAEVRVKRGHAQVSVAKEYAVEYNAPQKQTHNHIPRDHRCNAEQLHQEMLPFAEHESFAPESIIVSEQTLAKHAPNTADAMHCEDAEWVVDLQTITQE